MIREDKEIPDKKMIYEIIEQNHICRLAFANGDEPYIVPVNYGYKDEKIYVHSALSGRKLEMLKANSRICFEISDSVEIVTSDVACGYTTKYRSAIGYGTAKLLTATEDKIISLNIIMKQHTGKSDWDFSSASLSKMLIIEITIDSVTGKNSGYKI